MPFGSLAFMPGKLIHTNELTVLLGDNWFTKCSAKQAQTLIEHRKKRESHLDSLDRLCFSTVLCRHSLNDKSFSKAITNGSHGVIYFMHVLF